MPAWLICQNGHTKSGALRPTSNGSCCNHPAEVDASGHPRKGALRATRYDGGSRNGPDSFRRDRGLGWTSLPRPVANDAVDGAHSTGIDVAKGWLRQRATTMRGAAHGRG